MGFGRAIFEKADELDGLPEPNRRNYLFELEYLERLLPQNASVLQIGSMDGMRLVRLHEVRPDLRLTGLEIDHELARVARQNLSVAGVRARIVNGDVTEPPRLGRFDWVICLNHTLGYIPDQKRALRQMSLLGDRVVVSVYGEKFDAALARDYFGALGLDDYGGVHRYTREDLQEWGGLVTQTPIGYLVVRTYHLETTS